MKRVKIAILDTGLADEYDDPRICEKKQIFYNYDNEIVYVDGATDYNGHGTSCVDVILHYAESVELYILRFLDISGNARVDVFEKAMEIVEQKDVDIITVCLRHLFVIQRKDSGIYVLSLFCMKVRLE